MNHWEHLLHHHAKTQNSWNWGMRRRDTGTLADTLAAQTPTVKMAGGAALGALIGHLAGKHALIGGVIGLAGGYVASKQTTAAAPATTA